MIYKNINEESYLDRMPITIINGKRYGRNPLPSDFPKMDKLLYDNEEINVSLLRIPREYARNNEHFTLAHQYDYESLDMVECYNLYLYHQVGDHLLTKKDTYVLLKLPSGKIVSIILYYDGGVDFEPSQRKYVLREYDALDRRIILGFCNSCSHSIKEVSHNPMTDPIVKGHLGHTAMLFKEKDLNKRIKTGREGVYPRVLNGRDLMPYEEMGIFESVKFLNA